MAKLDPHFALFNLHINNAGERAIKILEEHFPSSWVEKIRTLQASGIMALFDEDPAPATAAYLALVTAFVNESEGDQPS